MLWILQERKTCSGTTFASWVAPMAVLLKSALFDMAPLLYAAAAFENNEQDNMKDVSFNDEPNVAPGESPVPLCHRRRHLLFCILSNTPATSVSFIAAVPPTAAAPRPGQPGTSPTETPPCRHGAAHGYPRARHQPPTAVQGSSAKYGPKKHRTLQGLIAMGFWLIHWDGITARPIVNAHDHIIAHSCQPPQRSRHRLQFRAEHLGVQALGCARLSELMETRWKMGLDLFSTVEEPLEDVEL
ncbi:hypothetical protein C8F04DRAFT_1258199 [Mycena alexandri]|uniref:Uncharacterized protein n=1 Tax=Mycena alexandri TaxID=1745969 RepID=A0AAD6T095_9AGAR|nr:hypothetical protein C8F04DRAFT_1258199 [Mycena alexandri]